MWALVNLRKIRLGYLMQEWLGEVSLCVYWLGKVRPS